MSRRLHHLFTSLRSAFLVVAIVTLSACRQPSPVAGTSIPPATTPTTVPAAPTSIPPVNTGGTNKMGVHLLLDDGRNQWPVERWREHMQYARRAVGAGGYVTELVRINDLNVERWQRFMDLCAELQLTPIIRLATTFDRTTGWWRAPEADADGSYRTTAARYATFLTALRWPSEHRYVIVGNEPNRGDEWGGQPDPVAYGRFLLDVADAVGERDADVFILNAGLDLFAPHSGDAPAFDGRHYIDAETFLDRMHAADPDVFSALDVWNSHAYPIGPFTAPPWQQTFTIDVLNDAVNPARAAPPPGIHNRGINGYRWELFKLSTYGIPALPVMITETGWRHRETTDPAAKDTGTDLLHAESAAIFLDMALRGNRRRYPEYPEHGWTPWLSDPQVVGITPFALNGLPAEWGHTNWLMLDAHGAVLGTYPIIESLATGNAQRSTRQD